MDQKTLEALTLLRALSDQIRDLKDNANSFLLILGDDRAHVVVGSRSTGMVAFSAGHYPAVCLNKQERAELSEWLERYRNRLDDILAGCSIKLSQDVKDLLAEGEKFRDDMRKQAAALKSENGDKKK